MDMLPVQPIISKRKKSDNDSKQQKKREAIKIVDTPKKLVWSFTVLFLTKKAIIITSKHGTKFLFPIKILFLENFKNNCPEKLA